MSARTFNDANSIEARQHLLDNRCEHAPKRHGTGKRSSKQKMAAKRKAQHVKAVQAAKRTRYLAASRDFWSGKKDEHP